MARGSTARNGNGANLGFEATLWKAADAQRGQVDAAECKHIVLGLVFLKYISDAYEAQHRSARGCRAFTCTT
jgi:type I restriction enzyme M protein